MKEHYNSARDGELQGETQRRAQQPRRDANAFAVTHAEDYRLKPESTAADAPPSWDGVAESQVSSRIDLLRYSLITGIVLLHTPPYVPLSELPEVANLFASVKLFFQSAFFRVSVPTLAAISGYLMFVRTPDSYKQMVAKKARTILLPMVIWNLLAFAVLFAAAAAAGDASTGASEDIRSPYPFSLWSALDGIVGISGINHWNYPLNFLRDLFVLILLAPVVAFFLKRAPYLGLLLWSGVFFFNLDGSLVGRAAMPITFYLGGLAATQGWNLFALDRYRVPLFLMLVVFCWAIVEFRISDQRLFRTLAPILVWPAASLLTATRIGQFMMGHAEKSFFIFLSHAFGLKFYSMIFERMLPFSPDWVAWVCIPAATIFSCHIGYRLMDKAAPRMLAVLTGGRTRRFSAGNRKVVTPIGTA